MNREAGEQKIQEIVRKIVNEYQPEKIILFGSWAWGEPHEWSDVDLFIVKESGKSRIERQRELRRLLLENNFPPLDLLVYTPAEVEQSVNTNGNLFIEDIIRNGIVLYAKPGSEIRIIHERPLAILQ